MVPELHVRMVCLLKAVTSHGLQIWVFFKLVIDYIRYCGSFEVLQAIVKCRLLVGSARPVPRSFPSLCALWAIIVSFMYIT